MVSRDGQAAGIAWDAQVIFSRLPMGSGLLAWAPRGLGRLVPPRGTPTAIGERRWGNVALLLVATGGIIVEAIGRLHRAEPVSTRIDIWVAAIGIVVNGATALLFMRDRHSDMNIKGAFLPGTADAGISFGVVIAAVLTMWTGWFWLDPVVSFAIAFAVLFSGWGSRGSRCGSRRDQPGRCPGLSAQSSWVSEVHDLHIWAMSITETALTAHRVRPGAGLDDRLLRDTARELAKRFGIGHATLHVEAGPADHACRLADESPWA
jgi:cobalt-zinc-cadmium efflux system protein